MSALRFSDTISATLTDGVLVVTIDNPPVNALSADVRTGLMAALGHAEKDSAIAGVVLTGAGNTFIGGADIKEFGKPPVEPLLPQVIARIEDFPNPSSPPSTVRLWAAAWKWRLPAMQRMPFPLRKSACRKSSSVSFPVPAVRSACRA